MVHWPEAVVALRYGLHSLFCSLLSPKVGLTVPYGHRVLNATSLQSIAGRWHGLYWTKYLGCLETGVQVSHPSSKQYIPCCYLRKSTLLFLGYSESAQSILQMGEDCHRKNRMAVLATVCFISDLKKLIVILLASPQKGDVTLVLANSTQEHQSLDVSLGPL